MRRWRACRVRISMTCCSRTAPRTVARSRSALISRCACSVQAGLAVTSRLMAHGRDVLVLDRPPMRKPWGGETFTGAIRGPLAELGFWEAFEGAGHVAGYERQSAWGGEPQAESTMFRTSGALWHVDRDRFNTDLRAAVVDRGGVFATYRRLETLRRESGRWRISLDNGMEVSATYLVDATGRMRILARRLGARIDVHDRLMGLTAKVSREEGSTEIRSMLIEATPFGWWYAAPTPTGHILAMFTDADLANPATVEDPGIVVLDGMVIVDGAGD
jgi:flavin-dependent dehydrogenase